MIKVKLADGTVLEDLELNGNNFISQTPVGDSVFEYNLKTVTIYEDGEEMVYKNMKLIQNRTYGEESWFILSQKTDDEIEKENLEKEITDLWDVVLFGGAE